MLPTHPSAVGLTNTLHLIKARAERLARRDWPRLDTDDLAQQAVIAYWETFGDGSRPDNLTGWLRTVIYRFAVDANRRANGRNPDPGRAPRERLVELDEIERRFDQMASSPSMVAIGGELQRRAVALVNQGDRDLFLARLGGEPARGVAERFGTTPAAVDQAYARAKRRIRARLLDDPELLRDLTDAVHQRGGRARQDLW